MKKFIKSVVERFPTTALFYRNYRDILERRQSFRKTPWGFKFAGHEDMAAGKFEPEETAVVRKLLLEVDVLINVGANVGYYCCHALSMGKPVIAIEPNVRNLHFLLKNIQKNGWSKKAEVFPVATGHYADILEMWGGGTGASLVKGWANIPESYVTSVPILSLDRILGDTLRTKKALIIVDIEGAEWLMLQGARKTLENFPPPIWLMEISFNEHQPVGTDINPNFAKTFELFFNSGYKAITADATAAKITPNTIAELIAGREKLFNHNFIFAKYKLKDYYIS